MNTDIQKVIARIAHLRKLADGNTNLHEAQAATKAADKLIQEYRISQTELEMHGNVPVEPMENSVVHSGGRRTAWRERLMWALTDHYGCTWYLSTGFHHVKYNVVGRKSDIEILTYMFNWLTDEIERLCKIHSKGKGVGYARSWLDGAAHGVKDTLAERKREMQTEQAQHSAAMVLLDQRGKEAKEAMRQMCNLKPSKSITGGRQWGGRADGYQVGRKIQIREGLGGAGKKTGLLT